MTPRVGPCSFDPKCHDRCRSELWCAIDRWGVCGTNEIKFTVEGEVCFLTPGGLLSVVPHSHSLMDSARASLQWALTVQVVYT